MFEPEFLGQVRILGQAAAPGAPAGGGTPAGAPGPGGLSPASSDSRFAPAASDFNNFNPFTVPFMPGYSYPPQYPQDRFNCVLSSDGQSWICTPRDLSQPVLVNQPIAYPIVPFGGRY